MLLSFPADTCLWAGTMVKQEALLLTLLMTIFCQTTTSKFHVNTDKNRIVDSSGRERLFHGTNVVQKTAPFVPITTHFDARLEACFDEHVYSIQMICSMVRYSFSEDDAKLMASMGYNTIRLGVLWAGLEPVMGEYNMTYLSRWWSASTSQRGMDNILQYTFRNA